jgi:hypothetical protein
MILPDDDTIISVIIEADCSTHLRIAILDFGVVNFAWNFLAFLWKKCHKNIC